MQLISYYVQRGHNWDTLANASPSVKLFLQASMERAIEDEIKKYEALLGGGR
jgi:hypothetical protein